MSASEVAVTKRQSFLRPASPGRDDPQLPTGVDPPLRLAAVDPLGKGRGREKDREQGAAVHAGDANACGATVEIQFLPPMPAARSDERLPR